MADEAFALSPINARPTLPTDADYDAIQEAFMETSRGRWFLTEYAKRNRNADTRMVLDAVEKLEISLASQKTQADSAAAEAAAAQVAAAEATLAEAIAARIAAEKTAAAQVAAAEAAAAEAEAARAAAMDAAAAHAAAAEAASAQAAAAQAAAARAAAAAAAPRIELWPELAKAFARTRMEIAQRLLRDSNDEAFEAIRASTETLKSISWALRERGFDVRICDFIDSQVGKITDGSTALMAESSVTTEIEAEILSVFDELIQHVEGLTSGSDAELETLDVVVDAVADAMSEDDTALPMEDDDAEEAAPAEMPAAAIAPAAELEEPAETMQVAPAAAADHDEAFREIYGDDSDIEIVDAAPPPPAPPSVPTEPEINRRRLYEAKLEPYRASETGPQIVSPADDIEIVDAAPIATAPLPHRPVINQPAPSVAAVEPVVGAPPVQPSRPSLGQALLDNGMIQDTPSRPDPLAPFRRMSQAEKIAFFT